MRHAVRSMALLAAIATVVGSWAGGSGTTLDSFALFAGARLDARGLVVESRDIGANDYLTVSRALVAPMSRVLAREVRLDHASHCRELHAERGDAVPRCGPRVSVDLPIIADVGAACGMPQPFPACDPTKPVTIGHGGEQRLVPGTYGAVVVAGGGAGPAKLELEAGAYQFCSLRVGRRGVILADGSSDVHVAGDVWLDNGSRVGVRGALEGSCGIRFYSSGRRVRISRRAVVAASICAPDARAELRVGARIHGAVFADAIRSDRITVSPCSTGPSTTTAPSSTTIIASSTTTSTSAASSSTGLASTSTSTTTTSAPTSTSSTTPTTSTTTSTMCPVLPSLFDFTTARGVGTCGETVGAAPGSKLLKNLLCGNLSLGGGFSTVADGPTPEGSTSRFALSCTGTHCDVGPSFAAVGATDCTDMGCRFGAPLPISNGGTSTCVENTFAQPAGGGIELDSGIVSLDVRLTSRAVLTGNGTQPCPICRQGSISGPPCAGTLDAPCAGVCEGSGNQGAACISTSAAGVSRDCPGPAASSSGNVCYKGPTPGKPCQGNSECGTGGVCALFIGSIPIALSPLTTESLELASDEARSFCPGQGTSQRGAFQTSLCSGGANVGRPCSSPLECPGATCRRGNTLCDGGANDGLACTIAAQCPEPGTCVGAGTVARTIRMRGKRLPRGCVLDVARPLTLVSIFCVPNTTSPLVNGAANLPGPGATSLPAVGTLRP